MSSGPARRTRATAAPSHRQRGTGGRTRPSPAEIVSIVAGLSARLETLERLISDSAQELASEGVPRTAEVSNFLNIEFVRDQLVGNRKPCELDCRELVALDAIDELRRLRARDVLGSSEALADALDLVPVRRTPVMLASAAIPNRGIQHELHALLSDPEAGDASARCAGASRLLTAADAADRR